MGVRYAAVHESAAASNKTLLQLSAVTGARAWLYEIHISSESDGDFAGQFDLIRGTTAGTGTGITPRKLDPAEGTSTYVAATGATITGHTKTSNSALLSVGLHQRQAFRWVAHPRRSVRITGAASFAAWVGIECIAHGSTPTIQTVMMWEE